jgi:rRNA small subunit pseudouridine methyltransferase Nep1
MGKNSKLTRALSRPDRPGKKRRGGPVGTEKSISAPPSKRARANSEDGSASGSLEAPVVGVASDDEDEVRPGDTIKAASTKADREKGKRVIVVMERASLEIVKRGADYQLLNCDDHGHIMRKHKREPADARPDIIHQCLLALLDSPLNKAGRLSVFVRSEQGVLIEVNPQTRIPRTFKRFSGLMVQLLHRLSVRAADGPVKLLKVIKNPVTDHLPTGAVRIGTSSSAPVVRLKNWVQTLPDDKPIVIVFGAMSHGVIPNDYVDQMVSFSEYPLSAACAIGKFLGAMEDKWDIV